MTEAILVIGRRVHWTSVSLKILITSSSFPYLILLNCWLQAGVIFAEDFLHTYTRLQVR